MKQKAIDFLISKGYTFKSQNITAPDTDSPLDAMAVQDELEDITDGEFTLMYVGDNLRLVRP